MRHEIYMQRCLDLAQKGLGTTYPNPLVGSVIVYRDKIIGERWHKKAGEAHAEVYAIRSVKEQELLKEATLYVSLEPCSHFGKTPPCANLIIEKKIPHVVIGTTDPFAKVAGRGIAMLKEAGVRVTLGILEPKCINLNKRFFCFHQQKRPYIILKWAQTADGFIAPNKKLNKQPFWISNRYAQQWVHKWRSEEQAILVGTNTVLEDNPGLDVRHWTGKNPLRVILDQFGKIEENHQVKNAQSKTIVYTSAENFKNTENILYENCIFDEQLPVNIMANLYQNGIQSIIIEGGRQTLESFIKAALWDEARIFTAPVSLSSGVEAPKLLQARLITSKNILNNNLSIYKPYDKSNNI
jgi:diaminohydroxyphosphoribosylaminopyrimidine deaminase / 5-amino-6-(5-phosphoribosylamino)uracil reductase